MSKLIFTFLIAISSLAYGNDPTVIKGIVRDKETEEPIPFAHIVIGNIVNISNVEGEFIITAPEEDESLKVSYMGYNDYTKPVTELDNYHTIYLEPSVTYLETVTVMTGFSIMDKVFDRFHLNYAMERQHMVGYYRESMSDWEQTYYVAEGIMDIYTPSDVDKLDHPLVQPLRTRKKVFNEIDEIEDVLGGNASDMAHSSIWRSGSFLSPKNRENYEYFYSGATTINNHGVFIVEFEPKNSKGDTKGKLYIDEESLAILRIEYFPIIEEFDYWESVSWTEEYEQKRGIFEMVSVSFHGTSTNHKFEYNALLVINESNTIRHIPKDDSLLNAEDAFFSKAQDNFNDSFWAGFNFMKLNSTVAQLLSKEDSNY